MKTTIYCPCCSSVMLHCLSHKKEYWFCRNCWQEMPNLDSDSFEETKHRRRNKIANLSIGFPKLKQPLSV